MTKALRALLACLCLFVAFPSAPSADPALRPTAAALAAPSVLAATASVPAVERATVPRRPAPLPIALRNPGGVSPERSDASVRDERRLYLENSSLLC